MSKIYLDSRRAIRRMRDMKTATQISLSPAMVAAVRYFAPGFEAGGTRPRKSTMEKMNEMDLAFASIDGVTWTIAPAAIAAVQALDGAVVEAPVAATVKLGDIVKSKASGRLFVAVDGGLFQALKGGKPSGEPRALAADAIEPA